MTAADLISVIYVTSPVPSHPDTVVLDQTVASVQAHLPGVRQIVACDGVNPALAVEKPERVPDYHRFLRRALRACRHDWPHTLPLVADEWLHQEALTRWALEWVETPLLLFVESDCPLADAPIDWDACCRAIQSGKVNVLRFHHEAHVLPEHQHLMLDVEPVDVEGCPVLRTIQWSQRPHLASAAWYRTMLRAYFTDDSRTMIEDVLHSRVQESYARHGETGWEEWRLAMYAPDGNLKRSWTTDGRGDDPKLEHTWVMP